MKLIFTVSLQNIALYFSAFHTFHTFLPFYLSDFFLTQTAQFILNGRTQMSRTCPFSKLGVSDRPKFKISDSILFFLLECSFKISMQGWGKNTWFTAHINGPFHFWAHARWAHMHHFLSVRLSVTKNPTRQKSPKVWHLEP